MERIVGISTWATQVRQRIGQVAPFASSVLITGPSGTGKELIARSIHLSSSRAGGPFVPVDCASIPGTLFASQLFGHVKGAFTGAAAAALGCFRAAEGGTIFLDEVGELDLELQSKMLRVIQERQVTPVGSHEPIPVDVRIVAATNRDLRKELAANRFRLDLYYRLDVVSLESAALKDRSEDIEPLSEYILEKMVEERDLPRKHLSAAAIRMMRVYDWPGNVRQLQNILERAVVLSQDEVIGPEWIPRLDDTAMPLPANSLPNGTVTAEASPEGWLNYAENEKEHLRRTLEQTGYNQSAAARMLGIDYRLLLRRMNKHGLKPSPTASQAK